MCVTAPLIRLPCDDEICKPVSHASRLESELYSSWLLLVAAFIQAMIFLILLYLCFLSGPSNSLALPTDLRPSDIFPRKLSIFIRDDDRFDTRSIYNILWSCLSTIFACTWITIHPNIPAPGDSQWAVLRRRLVIMGYLLLTPEFIIFWAARQHYEARYLTKKHIKQHTGWTRTHAFFLIMGGFTLHEGGKPVRILEARELEELWEAGTIKWPTVTKEEIADRSKGDYLSKTIVLFQTTWFVSQTIARGAYGLTVTELEVVTVAFASLTGIIYYLWWDKPLDVRCSIPVDLLDGRLGESARGIEKEGTGPQIILSPEISVEEITERDENVVVNPNPLPTPIRVDKSTPAPPPTRIHQFRAFRLGACEEYGTLFGHAYVFIGFSLGTISPRFLRHGGVQNPGRQKHSSTHILFILQRRRRQRRQTNTTYGMRSDSFWSHSLHRVVLPLRHIARTMGVENIGHPRFRPAHFLHPRRIALLCI